MKIEINWKTVLLGAAALLGLCGLIYWWAQSATSGRLYREFVEEDARRLVQIERLQKKIDGHEQEKQTLIEEAEEDLTAQLAAAGARRKRARAHYHRELKKARDANTPMAVGRENAFLKEQNFMLHESLALSEARSTKRLERAILAEMIVEDERQKNLIQGKRYEALEKLRTKERRMGVIKNVSFGAGGALLGAGITFAATKARR